jgi:hypothetical protein
LALRLMILALVLSAAALFASCTADCEALDEMKDCNGACEFDRGDTVSSCGEGGGCRSCPDPHLPNASASCQGRAANGRDGICGFACRTGFADCDRVASNGCETSLFTDPQNCGRCGRVCEGTCTERGCISAIAVGEPQVESLALSGGGIYWTSRIGASLLVRQGSPGAAPRTVAQVQTPGTLRASLAVQDDTIVVAGGGGTVFRIARDGTAVAEIASAQGGVGGVALDDRSFYWTNHDSGEVMRADRDGGVAVALATGFVAPRAITVDGGTVYWADEGDGGMGAVLALGPGAAAPEVLSDPPGTALQPQGLSVSREGVCWTGGGIEKVLWLRPFGGPKALEINTLEPSRPWEVTSIAACHFWPNTAAGTIQEVVTQLTSDRIPFPAIDLFSGVRSPEWIAADGTRLGWVEGRTDVRVFDP